MLYVEDEDAEPVPIFTSVLQAAGFGVSRVRSADAARKVLSGTSSRDLDLVVLDRKIPAADGGIASESVGDDLFNSVNIALPDVPIIVLSGYTDEDHARWVLQRPGALLFDGVEVRRFQHYRKGDSLEFSSAVSGLGGLLSAIDVVEIEGIVAEAPHRRVLKRTAKLYDGVAARVRVTQDGLSDAAVYLCEVSSADGRRLANVAVKVAPYGTGKPIGGFLSSIRSNMRATPTDVVSGCCGGLAGVVSPLAGVDAVALDAILASDADAARDVVESILAELSNLDRSQRQVALSRFGGDYLPWDKACELMEANGVTPPDGTLSVNETVVQSHGDLHLGNVLVIFGQPPCIIDFDSQFAGSASFDPLMLSLGPFFHRAGSLRNDDWHAGTIVNVFEGADGADPASSWARLAVQYCEENGLLRREFWAALLLYSTKQLKYDDVVDDVRLMQLAVELARLAVKKLDAS